MDNIQLLQMITEYRRHDDNNIIDRVWGNIWLIDDVVYNDSYGNGAVIHPEDGGTDNVLGLIAGGSVIIANTRPNGARGGQYGQNKNQCSHPINEWRLYITLLAEYAKVGYQ